MNEKHRLFIVLGIVFAIVLSVVGVTIVDAKTIEDNLPFILKWSKNPIGNGGAINPGWKQHRQHRSCIPFLSDRTEPVW